MPHVRHDLLSKPTCVHSIIGRYQGMYQGQLAPFADLVRESRFQKHLRDD